MSFSAICIPQDTLRQCTVMAEGVQLYARGCSGTRSARMPFRGATPVSYRSLQISVAMLRYHKVSFVFRSLAVSVRGALPASGTHGAQSELETCRKLRTSALYLREEAAGAQFTQNARGLERAKWFDSGDIEKGKT